MLKGTFALGFWRLADARLSYQDTEDLIYAALDNGISVMDHADIYGDYTCEELFGQVLKKNPELRKSMQIVSKCGIKFSSAKTPQHYVGHYDLSMESITASVDNSLKSLNVDYLDVLLVHRPSPLMDVNEIASAFSLLKNSGKVNEFGVSNFTPSQFDLLSSKVGLLTNQIEFSVLHNNPLYDGTLDQMQKYHTRPMAWSPLGGGALFAPQSPKQVQVVETLTKLASKYDASVDQLALAWLLKHPAHVIPVIGTQNKGRLVAATKAAKVDLELQDWFLILEAANGTSVR